jgi:hypothetical protein
MVCMAIATSMAMQHFSKNDINKVVFKGIF